MENKTNVYNYDKQMTLGLLLFILGKDCRVEEIKLQFWTDVDHDHGPYIVNFGYYAVLEFTTTQF